VYSVNRMPSTVRLAAGALALWLISVTAASADVVITWQRVTGKGSVVPVKVVETIAGSKQREDEFTPENVLKFSAIRDLATGKEYLLWHDFKLRQLETFVPRPQKPNARDRTMERRVGHAEGKPTGRSETILGVVCREYAFAAVSYDSKFTVRGSYWVPEKEDGAAEFASFYDRFSATQIEKEKGISKGNRARMRGRLELRREFLAAARRRGMPYRMEYEVGGSGTAPIYVKQEIVARSTEKVAPSVFEIPQHYKVR
jgi:hypothetical protein